LSPGRRRYWVAAATALVVLVVASTVVLLNQPASSTQRRADFEDMTATLRSDLRTCNRGAELALTAWKQRAQGLRTLAAAERRVQAAASACDPSRDDSLFNLTVYAVPSALSHLRLNYAVSCLGVWAQEDVQPALLAAHELLRQPQDQAAAVAYRRESGFAASNLATANLVLRRAATKLGVGNFRGIRLTALPGTSLPPQN
jgi:hypothetical protein